MRELTKVEPDTSELADNELNAASGGIIFVGGLPVVTADQNIGSNASGGGTGKITFNPFSRG